MEWTNGLWTFNGERKKHRSRSNCRCVA
jgi:hypothetical protein